MEDYKKIEIATEYISMHKNTELAEWMEANSYQIPTETEILLNVFVKLSQGEFGDIEEDGSGNFQIEISGHESKTGNPIIFEWEGAPIYMNPETGSIGRYSDWFYETEDGSEVNAVDLNEVVEVKKNKTGDWEEI